MSARAALLYDAVLGAKDWHEEARRVLREAGVEL